MTKSEYVKFTKPIMRATRGLMAKTPADKLDWRPDASFLTTGAVLRHLAEGFGAGLSAVADNGWAYRIEGGGSGLPPADAFPTVKSVTEALDMIDADWKLFEKKLDALDDAAFAGQVVKIPWMAPGVTLQEYMLHTTEHISNHRMQLFVYLRLLGVKVDTGTLYGAG
jgi:uncharacterized damage-inducible protein DinB